MKYASSVWDPHQKNDIQAIEKVQRRAARWVMSDYGRYSSVSSLLESLNWPTLKSRQRVSRFQAIYKGINKLSGLSIPSYLLPTQYPTTQTFLCIWVHIPVTIRNPFFSQNNCWMEQFTIFSDWFSNYWCLYQSTVRFIVVQSIHMCNFLGHYSPLDASACCLPNNNK